ncbi:hypothetical protein [Isoptericola sp. NPDC056134]|uniref:hypothetical protein n=1 Tax=Isoptericola sp. NPDC056134 TaxID=3345723 RepID=UPI0035E82D35
METTVGCDCVVASEEDGWRETRGPICEARDRAEWREFAEQLDANLDAVVADIRRGR